MVKKIALVVTILSVLNITGIVSENSAFAAKKRGHKVTKGMKKKATKNHHRSSASTAKSTAPTATTPNTTTPGATTNTAPAATK